MLKFDSEKHKYTWNDKVVPSVTKIINEVLKGDKEEQEPSLAQIKGTIIHKMLELHDQNNLGEYDTRLQGYIDAWQSFKKKYQPEILEIECLRYNEQECFAGTIDRVAVIGGRPTIIDIKTGNSYKEYPLQTAGYAILFGGITRRMCVYPKEDGTFEVEEHDNDTDLDVFKSLLQVWKWKKNKL